MTVQSPAQPQTITYLCPFCGTAVSIDAKEDGSLVTCPAPNCGKPFRVEVPVAHPAPLAIPAEGVQSAIPTVASTAGLQSAVAVATEAVKPPEVPESAPAIFRLSMFRRYPFRCLGYFLLELAGLAAVIHGVNNDIHFLTAVGAIILVLITARWFIWWLRMRSTTLTLTNKRGILTTGLFAQDSVEFDLARIADFHMHQTRLMRWLNVGDLAIVTSDTSRNIVVMALPNPQGVAALLHQHIEERKKEEHKPEMVIVQQPVVAHG